MKKNIQPTLKDEVLDQNCQNLKNVTQGKQLYLIPNLSLKDLSNAAGIPVNEIQQVLSERLQLTFFEFISEYKVI